VNITVNKVDEANTIVSGTLSNEAIAIQIDKMAIQAGKELNIDGFRKGKVPPHVVKKLHGEKLEQDAEGEELKELIDAGMKEAGIAQSDVLGQPSFKKYEKVEAGIEVEVEVSTRPIFSIEGYMDKLPAFEKPVASQEEIDAQLKEIAEGQAPFTAIETPREVISGDMTVINFEGFVDGVAFEGGKADDFNLQIGSGQFIPGFEDQIIGMAYDTEKEVTVTFPADYQSEDLAGKEAMFKVTVTEIQEKGEVELNDELAVKILQGTEDATLEMLTEKVKEQIESQAISNIYNADLKPQLVETLVAQFTFALPNNIVEQEIDAKVNAKAQEMDEAELETYKDNAEKVETLREEVRADAEASVRATFIVDALATEENVTVDDQEVSQAIYYEAMRGGQDPQKAIEYYQENNLLPAVKMGMIEDKLFGKLLGLDK